MSNDITLWIVVVIIIVTSSIQEAQANSVDLDMTEIMDPWVTQMNYPVVHVAVGSGTVTLTQERFLSSGGENPDQDAGKYGYDMFNV